MIFFVIVMIYGYHQNKNVKIIYILADMISTKNSKGKKTINIAS